MYSSLNIFSVPCCTGELNVHGYTDMTCPRQQQPASNLKDQKSVDVEKVQHEHEIFSTAQVLQERINVSCTQVMPRAKGTTRCMHQ